MELYGLAVLHTLAFIAGVNLFKEVTPMCSKTKRKRRKEEAHAEAESGGSGNAPLRAA